MTEIGLIDIEPKVFNTALMQIASYHRAEGDEVRWAAPLEYDSFDMLYCSSLFDFTDKSAVPARAICGGTGFRIKSELQPWMASSDLDYSIYPDCKTSYIWFSRGCRRNCPFCVVRRKEGKIRAVKPKNLNPAGEYITVMDNDFFGASGWGYAVRWLLNTGRAVDIQQGIDIRSITDNQCMWLKDLRHEKQIRFAWDRFADRDEIMAGVERLLKHVKAWRLMCYVLIGFGSSEAEDLTRVFTMQGKGIDPFVMPYNRQDPYQKAFARWVNRPEIFNSVPWQDYKYSKKGSL